jgi:DNA-binding beta-propeller fold protein YncE
LPTLSKRVYCLDNGRDSLSTFGTTSDGRLVYLNASPGPLPTPPNPLEMAIDRSAHRLYTTGGYGSNWSMGLFSLGADGTAAAAGTPGWPMPISPGAGPLVFAPSFAFAFLSDPSNQAIHGYRVQADGSLLLNNPTGGAVATGPDAFRMVVDPTGQFLFVGCRGGVWCYRIGSDGTLQLNNSVSGPYSLSEATELCMDRSGRWLYVIQTLGGTITTLEVAADGTLSSSSLPTATVTTGNRPWRLAMTPSGRYLYCVNYGSNNVSAYRINTDGTLTRNDILASTGAGPIDLAVAPEGSALYVANQEGGSISVFRIFPDGTLSALQDPLPAGINPNRIIIR